MQIKLYRMKIFITGNRQLKELPQEVIARIDNIIKLNAQVLLTDAYGTEALVQQYLKSVNYKNVTVYFIGDRPRNNAGFRCFKTPQAELRNTGYRGKGSAYLGQQRYLCSMADYGLIVTETKDCNATSYYMQFIDPNKVRIVRYDANP